MKTYLKSELAEMAGVSPKTFSRWLARNTEKLQELGYRKHDKYVYPRALEWICREYCIDLPTPQRRAV